MPVSHADGSVPDAALLNAIQADTVEVYSTLAARDEQSFVAGDVVWIIETGELLAFDGTDWDVKALLPEQERVVRHPSKVPLRRTVGIVSTDDVYAARSRGLETSLGAASVIASSANVATGGVELDDFYAHVGAVSDDEKDAAYNSVDDLSLKFEYAMPTPTLGSGTSMVRFLELDFPYQTIVMVGVSSLIFHRDLRCQIVVVGSGGFGGAAGAFRIDGTEQSAFGGGGGGAGAVSSVVADFKAGDRLEARCGGRIIYRDVEPILPDQIFRNGYTLDSAGQTTAVWLNGRLLGEAFGGSRGGSHPLTLQGRTPLERAYYVSGGSQGGAAGGSQHYSTFPPPVFGRSPYTNRGGAAQRSVGDARVLDSGGGGGGALGEGRDGQVIDFTNDLGTFAEGGLGGDGVNLGWNGVPTLSEGGKGGTAAGYNGAPEPPDETGESFGQGARGSSIALEEGVSFVENAGVNLSSNRPGLGAVLIRFRIDGGEFEETDV